MSLVYAENNYTSPSAGNIFAYWENLGIKSIKNMEISFTIKVTGVIKGPRGGWSSILHVTDDGLDEGLPGRRNPGIWINTDNNDPNKAFLLIELGRRISITTPRLLKQYYETEVVITFSGNTIKVYFNSILILNQPFSLNEAKEPIPKAIVYVKDPYWGEIYSYNDPSKNSTYGSGIYTGKNDNFIIKDLKLTNLDTDSDSQRIGKHKIFFIDTYKSLVPNRVLCNWSDLNIKSIQNLQIGFSISISENPIEWKNIIRITNNGNNNIKDFRYDCCNIGDRTPAIFMSTDGHGIFMHVTVSSTVNGNNWANFYLTDKNSNRTTAPMECNILISFFNNRLFFSLNGKYIPRSNTNENADAGIAIGGTLTEPNPNALVCVKDKHYGPFDRFRNQILDNSYKIKNLIFTESLNNGITSIVKDNVTVYFPGSTDLKTYDYTQLISGTKLCNWKDLNIDSINNLQISFQLCIKEMITPGECSIIHVSNGDGNGNCCTAGNRCPYLFINQHNGGKIYFLVVTGTNRNSNNNVFYYFNGGNPFTTDKFPYTVSIQVIWTNNTLFVSFDGVFQAYYANPNSASTGYTPSNAYFVEPTNPNDLNPPVNPPRNPIVYTKDPWVMNNNDNKYAIKNLTFSKVNNISYANNSFVFSPNVYSFLRPNNYVCPWSKLGIMTNRSMIVFFSITISVKKSYSRNIFKITSNDSTRNSIPSVSISPNSLKFLITATTQNTETMGVTDKKYETVGSISLNTKTDIKIIFNSRTIKVYFNNILDSTFNDNSTPPVGLLKNADNDSKLFIKGQDSTSDGIDNSYLIQGLTFSEFSPLSYLNYEYQGCYDDDLSGNTKIFPIIAKDPIFTVKDCAKAAFNSNADVFAMQKGGSNKNVCYLGYPGGTPAIDYKKFSENKQRNTVSCQLPSTDKTFGGINVNQVYSRVGKNPVMYEISGTGQGPTQGNVFKIWKDLNIRSIQNMAISFVIRLDNGIYDWRNIFRITNTTNNCCNKGDRIPGLFISPDSTPVKDNNGTVYGRLYTLCLTIDTQNRPNEYFYFQEKIQSNQITRVDIVFNKTNIKTYITKDNGNGGWSTTNNSDKYILQGGDMIEPLPSAKVYISDPYHNNPIGNGYELNHLSFIDTNNNMVCGSKNFCIGYEPDSNVYCYNNSTITSCTSLSNTCDTDNDCRSNLDMNSPKSTDNTYVKECPVAYSTESNDPWQRYACPNSYARIAQALPELTNPDFSKKPAETIIPITDETLNYGQNLNEINQENQQYLATGNGGAQSSTYDLISGENTYGRSTESFVNSEQIKQNNGNYYLLILVLIIIIVFVTIFFTLKPGKKRGK